ncbi:MAG: deoxyguanosinetriphosphate triphosphohydrolase family protein [Clostridia bacterium]
MKKFEEVAATKENPKWENMIKRRKPLYSRENEKRTEFGRDYTRIIHSRAYRRLKHKTQVFFSPSNDHICTRIEHVNYVESISYTIANALGLNTELTKAISVAHDLGHSPFGHVGEKVLDEIARSKTNQSFWHERNGLYLVDSVELLEDKEGNKRNLDLTYAVRDGIISHCGEVDENRIKPRKEAIDLNAYTMPNAYSPYTWEACVVKIADKISYIGRDLEDALKLKLLDKDKIEELREILGMKGNINNTNFINMVISDVCDNSHVEEGLGFSSKVLEQLNRMKAFNYENIYMHRRLEPSNQYFKVVLHQIFDTLYSYFKAEDTLAFLEEEKEVYPKLLSEFQEWVTLYSKQGNVQENQRLYDLANNVDYAKAIIDYIAGMTDNYAIEMYEQIIRF